MGLDDELRRLRDGLSAKRETYQNHVGANRYVRNTKPGPKPQVDTPNGRKPPRKLT